MLAQSNPIKRQALRYKFSLSNDTELKLKFFFFFVADNELVFRDWTGGLSILSVDTLNLTQIVSNTTFVSSSQTTTTKCFFCSINSSLCSLNIQLYSKMAKKGHLTF
jgi:hypothetical protein